VQLYLCEKPSQARDIARVLGVSRKGDGCLQGSDTTVTWCFGHLLEMLAPDGYDPAYKRWQFETLPIIPGQWKLEVRKEARKQYNIIRQLLKKASSVVIATDADREGETIAREMLQLCQWRGPVTRLWLSALDDASIRKALANVLPGSRTEALYHAGLGRARADWLVGMNLTRAYTLIGRQGGHDGVLSVGRVQTPALNLVVERDLAIEAFTPSPYYEIHGTFQAQAGQFTARWLPPAELTDSEGRCTNLTAARTLAQKIEGQQGKITKAETTREKEAAPLPFDLSTLQQETSKRWGMGAQEVLDTAQALYETHKALTYPRTDCPYLPDSQRADATQVLSTLKQSDPVYAPLVDGADAGLCSRAWNDKKITAHHAIIPTTTSADVTKMSQRERRLYDLVSRRYIAQFYPAYEYDKTVIEVIACNNTFRVSGNVPRVDGWRSVLGQARTDSPDDNADLPAVSTGEVTQVLSDRLDTRQTKPPPRYTEGSLIAAMKSIGKQISDPKLKKVLRDTSGIGTEATRAGIIETLLQRCFLTKAKKDLISTPTGRALIAMMPAQIKDPATTALWEQGLDDIAQGRGNLPAFIAGQAKWIEEILRQVKQQSASGATRSAGFGDDDPAQHPCPQCAKPLRRRKGKNGWFWGCTAYPDCKSTLPDNRGKPGQANKHSATRETHGGPPSKIGDACPQCRSGKLVQRSVKTGKNAGRPFIGCTAYPKCDYFARTYE
jgi:DNA topoisomerase-3